MFLELETEIAKEVNKAKTKHAYWRKKSWQDAIDGTIPTGFISDVVLCGDYLDALSDTQIAKMVRSETVARGKLMCPRVHVKDETEDKSFGFVYTIVGYYVAQKFGSKARGGGSGKPRYYKDSPEVKDYAREVMKQTVARLLA
jgi:hypothetical protein